MLKYLDKLMEKIDGCAAEEKEAPDWCAKVCASSSCCGSSSSSSHHGVLVVDKGKKVVNMYSASSRAHACL